MSCLNIQRLATPERLCQEKLLFPGLWNVSDLNECKEAIPFIQPLAIFSRTHFSLLLTLILFKHLYISNIYLFPHTFWNPYPTKVVNHGWSSPSAVVPLPVINLGTFHAYLFADVTIYVSVTCSDIVTWVWFWLRGEGYVLKGLGNDLCWKKLTERSLPVCCASTLWICMIADLEPCWDLGREQTEKKARQRNKTTGSSNTSLSC